MPVQVTCADATTEPRRFATAELRRYLQQMGVRDARIELRVAPAGGLSDEGYMWEQVGDTITLTAGGDGGLVFGVYALLRDVGGCRFSGLGPDGEYVPRRDALDPIPQLVRREPKLWYRGIQFSSLNPAELYRQQIDWMAKNGLNYLTVLLAPDQAHENVELDPATGEPVGGDGNTYRITEAWMDQYLTPEARRRGMKIDVNHHNFRLWLPPARYMDAHPEWFSLHNGVRGSRLEQLCICTSNDEAVAALIDNVRQFLRRRPDVKLVGVIPEDGQGMCQCEKCRAMDANPADADRPHNFRDPADENRALADRYARLLNQVASAVAAEFPDVLIGGAAYVDAQWPSRTVPLEKNITVWFATYWRDGSRPLCEGVESHINAMFIGLLKQWRAKLTGPLIEYAYYMGMNAQRGLPYPMARVICKEWPHLKSIGVQGATIQCLATCHDAYGLNLTAFARSGWADHVDYDQLCRDYLRGMFGSAAEAIEPIYHALEDAAGEIAAQPLGRPDGKIQQGIMQPNGENAKFFVDRLPDVDAALAQARRLCRTEAESRQVERFAQYVAYWRLAAEATDVASSTRVIDYLKKMPENGWFARSATAKWRSAIARLSAGPQHVHQ